jgi:hypothetical protein
MMATDPESGREGIEWTFINSKGNKVFTSKFRAGACTAACEFMPQFSEDLCVVEDENGRFGYMDKTGKVVIPMKFSWACNFSEGLACVIVNESKNNYYFSFIDKSGNEAINKRFYFYEEDIFEVQNMTGCSARSVSMFKNGVCEMISHGGGDVNNFFINRAGEKISPPSNIPSGK